MKQEGLYQTKVSSSLNSTYNCIMVYSLPGQPVYTERCNFCYDLQYFLLESDLPKTHYSAPGFYVANCAKTRPVQVSSGTVTVKFDHLLIW